MLQNTMSTICMLFILIAIGWCLGGKAWFAGADNILSKYLTKAALPCLVFCNVCKYFYGGSQMKMLWKAGLFIILILSAALSAGLLFAAVLHISDRRRGIFIGAVLFPNVILLGFPIIGNILGEEAMPYGVVFFMVDTITFWVVGPLLLTVFGQEGVKIQFSNIRKIFSGSLLAILAGVLVITMQIPVPEVINSALEKMAQSSTAVSMVFIGVVIRNTKLKKFDSARDIVWAFILKQVVIPLLIIMILKVCPLDTIAKNVLFLLAVMPMAVNFSVIAHEYDCDYEYAAILTSGLNLCGLAAVPFYIYVINQFHIF